MENPIITFDRHWKKLRVISLGNLFTTIRMWTPSKKEYYDKNIGNIFDIEITDTKSGFRGFKDNEKYIVLLFEALSIGIDISKAMLLQTFEIMGKDISNAFRDYDTEE